MKVVLFCGGLGLRLRGYSETIPKPMVPIGHRPILWHVMKYYAHFGHKDFILCLGWQGNMIKDFFLNYNECMSNDFVMSHGGAHVDLLHRDIDDWNIAFVDTGTSASIGQRLRAVEHYLDDDEVFLANYADGLTDLYLPDLIDLFHERNAIATFLSVRPSHSFHTVVAENSGLVRNLAEASEADIWINGGFLALHRQIFDYMEDGEDLVAEPFQRLIHDEKLVAKKYNGFWGCMDTYKEKQLLEDMYARGNAPWELWKDRRPDRLPVVASREPPRKTTGSGHPGAELSLARERS